MHFRAVDLEEFAKATGGDLIYANQVSRRGAKSFVGLDRKPSQSVDYINPVMTVARLPRVVVKGEHSIPFSVEKGLYVTHRLTHSDYNSLWHAGAWTQKNGDGIEAELGNVALHIKEPAFLMCMAGIYNFGHFVWEGLAKALMLSQIPEHRSLKILCPDTLPERFFLWLQAIGIERNRLIPIPAMTPVFVDTLYVATAAFGRTAKMELIAHEASLHYMRQALFAGASRHAERQRLFFSRADAGTRRCVNEAEVYALFEPHDVRLLTGTNTPAETQLSYIRSAELIVAPIGAACAAAAFAPEDCMIVELTPTNSIFGTFNSTISALFVGQPFARIEGKQEVLPDSDPKPLNWDYSIDAESAQYVLARFLDRAPFET